MEKRNPKFGPINNDVQDTAPASGKQNAVTSKKNTFSNTYMPRVALLKKNNNKSSTTVDN